MDASGKILFVCPSCGYRAKIPGNYLGMSIRCPGCSTAQTVVQPADKVESTGKTVSITRVATTPLPFTVDEAKQSNAAFAANSAAKLAAASPMPGLLDSPAPTAQAAGGAAQNMVFICSSCGFRARIPLSYAGKSIFCPKCNVTQVAPAVATPPASGSTVILHRVNTPVATASPATTPARGTPVVATDASVSSNPQVDLSDKILFTCGSCGMRARIPSKYAGTTIKCPKCATPGQVPLSEAMEEATGRTVSVSRVDLARKDSAPKRPSGEFSAPSTAPAPLSAPASRPSGEIAMPASTSAANDELNLEVDVSGTPSAQAETETLPPESNPVAKAAAKVAAAADDELLDLGPVTPMPPVKRGGVVKRRGSSSSNSSAERPVTDRTAARESPGSGARGAGSQDARSERPMSQTESSPAPDTTKPRKTAPARAAAREDSDEEDPSALTRRGSQDALKTHGMLWLGLTVVVLALCADAFFYMKWQSASSSASQSAADLSSARADAKSLRKERDDLKDRLSDLDVEMGKLKQSLDDAKASADKAQMEISAAKAEADHKAIDQDAKIKDLDAKLGDAKKTSDDQDAKIKDLTEKLQASGSKKR